MGPSFQGLEKEQPTTTPVMNMKNWSWHFSVQARLEGPPRQSMYKYNMSGVTISMKEAVKMIL